VEAVVWKTLVAMAKGVIVIGAGWSGLVAAKTYLEVDPSIDLTILEADDSVGGVWSASRIYPGLVADSPRGLYENSDMTMVDEKHIAYGSISCHEVHDYLHGYAEKHDLLRRTKFQTTVETARRKGNGWILQTKTGESFECDKLLVSTGLASKPNWPKIPNHGFNGPVLHSKYLGTEYPQLTAASVQDVVVVGGCKSAVEAATICLNAGKTVHWIIRDPGNGCNPFIMLDHDPNAIVNIGAIVSSRLFGQLSPSMYNISGFWYNFLHSGRWWLGKWIVNSFWSASSNAILAGPKYDSSENGKKIKPEMQHQTMFWNTTAASLIPSKSPFINLVHEGKQLKVYRATPMSLSSRGMRLSSGELVAADAVLYATGWAPTTDIFTEGDRLELGLPAPLGSEPASLAKHWESLHSQADMKVKAVLPKLANPPPHHAITPTNTPYRLYRHIVSPATIARNDRSIAFVGFVSTIQTAQVAELGALWAVAYMEDLFPKPLPSNSEIEKNVADINAWVYRRHLSKGRIEPIIDAESQTLFDTLMRDLGLKSARKRKGWLGWLKEWVLPYKSSDYRGVVGELLGSRKEKTN